MTNMIKNPNAKVIRGILLRLCHDLKRPGPRTGHYRREHEEGPRRRHGLNRRPDLQRRNGIQKIIEVPLNEKEQEQMQISYKALKEVQEQGMKRLGL